MTQAVREKNIQGQPGAGLSGCTELRRPAGCTCPEPHEAHGTSAAWEVHVCAQALFVPCTVLTSTGFIWFLPYCDQQLLEAKSLPVRQLILIMKLQNIENSVFVPHVENFAEVTYKALLDFSYSTMNSI